MIKLREVYRHLSNAADRGEEAANVIADIVVKTAKYKTDQCPSRLSQ
jgi:hypothetical protein